MWMHISPETTRVVAAAGAGFLMWAGYNSEQAADLNVPQAESVVQTDQADLRDANRDLTALRQPNSIGRICVGLIEDEMTSESGLRRSIGDIVIEVDDANDATASNPNSLACEPALGELRKQVIDVVTAVDKVTGVKANLQEDIEDLNNARKDAEEPYFRDSIGLAVIVVAVLEAELWRERTGWSPRSKRKS